MLSHFPKELGDPRPQQIEGINFINNAFKNDINFCVLEMPTGSGKSGVALAVSRYFGGGIVACPTVQLQVQYLKDFNNVAPLIGRSRFPCLKTDPSAADSIPIIQDGRIPVRPPLETSCATGPCLKKPKERRLRIKSECETIGGCPHQHSIDVAQKSETIISNLHSLVYCVALNETVETRKVLIIDEAHDLKKFMRDFLKVKFKVRRRVALKEVEDLNNTESWIDWLKAPEQMILLTDNDKRESYLERLEKLQYVGETVTKTWLDPDDKQLWIEFTPVNISKACQTLLFSLADNIILMSGTIYSKETFLRPLGVDPSTAAFIRIESDFPVKNRQVYLPSNRNLDLSHRYWKQNLPAAIKEIQKILDNNKDTKGIIHTNSYRMSQEICECLQGDIIHHTSEDFADNLKVFQKSSAPSVFISPVCTQGVDFKDDLARWQIIIRPAYASIEDPYIKYCLDNGWWGVYNADAAIILGQQLGRIVRSIDDYGDTYLISSTFYKLLHKTGHLFPKWLKKGFVR